MTFAKLTITCVHSSIYSLEISRPNGDIKIIILRNVTPCSLLHSFNFSDGPVASIFSVDNKKMVTTGSSITCLPPYQTTHHSPGHPENLRSYRYIKIYWGHAVAQFG
jgi:hypothetical protein